MLHPRFSPHSLLSSMLPGRNRVHSAIAEEQREAAASRSGASAAVGGGGGGRRSMALDESTKSAKRAVILSTAI